MYYCYLAWFDYNVQWPHFLSSVLFCPYSPHAASQPSADLRQFAKQEALQHAAVPAHLDRVDKHTLLHPNVHPRTCTLTHTSTHALKFMCVSRMSQQDIRACEDYF